MADAVLSGRDRRIPYEIKRLEGSQGHPGHGPVSLADIADELNRVRALSDDGIIAIMPNDPRLPPGMQAEADEAFARANSNGNRASSASVDTRTPQCQHDESRICALCYHDVPPSSTVFVPEDRTVAAKPSQFENQAYVIANWPGICRSYANEPECPEGCIAVKMGGKEQMGTDYVMFEASTPYLPPVEAWAAARQMAEERMKVASR
jgi:hypothetical protein